MQKPKKSGFILLLTLLSGGAFIVVLFLVFQPAIGKVTVATLPTITSSLQRLPTTFQQNLVEAYPTITPHRPPQASPTPPALYSAEQLTPLAVAKNEIENEVDTQQDKVNSRTDEALQNPFVIGYSINGLPLEMYHFGNGSSARLIIAGIHGGYEYNTTNLAYELIAYIIENPQIIPADVTLFILPSLNPDGLVNSHGYAGRANMSNVDLNRNWDHNWAAEWDPNGCWQYLPITGGTGPLSEPETMALNDFILAHELDAAISYHSAGLGIFAGGSPDTTVSEPLAKTIAAVSPYPYPPVFTVCEFTGQFTDYLSTRNIPAVDIELTNHKDTDFEINIPILITFLNWQAPEQ